MLSALRPVSLAAAATLAAAAPALTHADIVRVRVTGTVENNAFAAGALTGIPPGAPVVLQLDVDSSVFIDSVALPGRTRAYPITGNSLTFTAGSVTVTRNMSFAANFCLRNNDPRADGFFLSRGTDNPTPIVLNLGVPQSFGVAFTRTFNIDPPFPTPDNSLTSLDILTGGAIGSWGFNDLCVYHFAIEQNEISVPMSVAYQTITISRIGCTGALCPADFNCSGGVSVQDIFDFLADWSSQSAGGPIIVSNADFNGVDGVTVQDIFDFLAAWTNSCA